jgi:Tfp pilus assembly protein PilF
MVLVAAIGWGLAACALESKALDHGPQSGAQDQIGSAPFGGGDPKRSDGARAILAANPGMNAACAAAFDAIRPPPPLPPGRPRDTRRAEEEFARGVALSEQGDQTSARDAYDNAIAADPYHGLAYLGKAESHLYTDNDQVAIRSLLERAVELLPENPRVHLRFGEFFAEAGSKPLAEAEWRCAIELRKDLLEARLHLARLIFENGDPATAEHELRDAVAIAPADVQAHVLLGDVLEAEKKIIDAAKEIESAAQLAAKSAALYRRASTLYTAGGNLIAAKRTKKEADKLDPPPKIRKLRPLLKRN